MSHTSFAKRQREKDRKEKADAKAAKKAERRAATDDAPDTAPADDQEALLAALADLHARFADDQIDFEDFTAAKADITRRLHVE